jgi:pyrroloquinoline-quinone synthase
MSDQSLQEIDRLLAEHGMLKHPFYLKWNRGELTKEHLRQYACQYYHFVSAFPRMVSAVHSNTPDLEVRRALLQNLNEEEQGEGNHPALWMKFANALGVSRKEVEATRPLPTTTALVDTMMTSARDADFPVGVASLYAYEAQIPEVSRVKIDGLKKFYGIEDAGAIEFFTVHEEADVHHSAEERQLLADHTSPALAQAVRDSAERTARALWHFLDGVDALAVAA